MIEQFETSDIYMRNIIYISRRLYLTSRISSMKRIINTEILSVHLNYHVLYLYIVT